MTESRFSKALKVWHGSPYDWDKPDPAKALTGEGAQVYGHGSLYVAEAQPVAEEYMKATTKKRRAEARGDQWWQYNGSSLTASQLLRHNVPPEVRDFVLAPLSTVKAYQKKSGVEDLLEDLKKGHATKQAAASWLEQNMAQFEHKSEGGGKKPPGRLYELELGLEDHEILDWDEAVEDHHPEALNKLSRLAGAKKTKDFGYLHKDGEDLGAGGDLYRWLTDKHGSPVAASKALQDAGIQAIRYKDQLSREPARRLLLDGVGAENHKDLEEMQYLGNEVDYLNDTSYNKITKLDHLIHHVERRMEQSRGGEYEEHWKNINDWVQNNLHRLSIGEKPPTYNYVVFDPSRIRVLRKYGIKGQLVEDLTKAEGPVVLTAQPGRQKED